MLFIDPADNRLTSLGNSRQEEEEAKSDRQETKEWRLGDFTCGNGAEG